MRTTLSELESVAEMIRRAGGKPNHRFYAALRAIRALEQILADEPPPMDLVEYEITLANGRTVKVTVGKGEDVFAAFKRLHLEVQSFRKL